MDYRQLWIESTLEDLYNSSVEAFPKTAYRQHAVDPIKIVRLSIIPFKGLNTVFFKGLANNEGRNYNPIILFKNVKFSENGIKVKADDGHVYRLKPLSITENNVAVRCNCLDFYWRFSHYNYLDKSLYGRDRKKYEATGSPANPNEMEGMCKHLMKLSSALKDSGVLHE